jgi:hypothetical protein
MFYVPFTLIICLTYTNILVFGYENCLIGHRAKDLSGLNGATGFEGI